MLQKINLNYSEVKRNYEMNSYQMLLCHIGFAENTHIYLYFPGGEHSHSHDHIGEHEQHHDHGHSHSHSLKDLTVGLCVLGKLENTSSLFH